MTAGLRMLTILLGMMMVAGARARAHDGIPPYPAPLQTAWDAALMSAKPSLPRAAHGFLGKEYLKAARALVGPVTSNPARRGRQQGSPSSHEAKSEAAFNAWVLAAIGEGLHRKPWIEAACDALDAATADLTDSANTSTDAGLSDLALCFALSTVEPKASPGRHAHWNARMRAVPFPSAHQPDEPVGTEAIAAAFLRREAGLVGTENSKAALEVDDALAVWRTRFSPSGVCESRARTPTATSALDLETRLGLACILEEGYAGAHRYYFEEMLTRGARTTWLELFERPGSGRGAKTDDSPLFQAALRCAVFELRARGCIRSAEFEEARAMRAAAYESLATVRTTMKAAGPSTDRTTRLRSAAVLAIAWQFADKTDLHPASRFESGKAHSVSQGATHPATKPPRTR